MVARWKLSYQLLKSILIRKFVLVLKPLLVAAGLCAGVFIMAIPGQVYAADEVDAVSGATELGYNKTVTVDSATLANWLSKHITGAVVGTVNPDGSPHATLIYPILESENIIRFALAHNQTRQNIDRTGQAFITVYAKRCRPQPGAGGTLCREFGERLILSQLKPATPKEQKTKGVRVTRMKITRVLPLAE
nr:hypothetical protein [uncultured Desulfobacter sp.]